MDDNYFEVEEQTPLLPGQQQADDVPQIDLEPEGPRPPSRQKRVMQISLVLVALVVVAVLFHGVVAPASPPGGGVSSPDQTSVPPITTLIVSNINFGTVTINDKRQRGTVPMFFDATNGDYTITITAPPFLPQTCGFSFSDQMTPPNPGGDNCGVITGGLPSTTANGVTATPLYGLEIDFTAENLPLDQQKQINTVLSKFVSAQQTTTVPAGSYIATNFNAADNTITSQRIFTPLQATASLAASSSGALPSPPCQGLICPIGIDLGQYASSTGMDWVVGVPVALRWHFATSAGQVLGDVSFPADSQVPVLLGYSPSTGWRLSQSLSDPITDPNQMSNLDCQTGYQILQQQFQFQSGNFNFEMSSGQGIEGCKLIALSSNGSSQGTFLWRFGVLLAADDAAHSLAPNLPIAPQAEINAVQG